MQSSTRIILNSIILYAKIVICLVISLWTVPLVFQALGQDDYGLYNLVAGVIAMFAFLNAAMTVSTQRFLSVTIGEKNTGKLLQVFNLSFVLHIVIGCVVVVGVELSIPLLFRFNVVNVNPESVATANMLFHYLAVSMFFTILAVPFDAVLNAYENMLAFSILGVIDTVLRLCVALCLYLVTSDRLDFYGYSIMTVVIIVFLLKLIYTMYRYRHLRFSIAHCRNRALFMQLLTFSGWNTILGLTTVSRNQGVAIILNHFFGTVINAAYGIANQINGVLGYFSQTIQKSIMPQLMETKGTHDYQKLLTMTFGLTKFSTLCMGIVAIPLFIELPYILSVWLGEAPDHTVNFTRLIIILSVLFQLSSGLMAAIQSSGNIKWYTIINSLVLLSSLPLAYVALCKGDDADIAIYLAILTECMAFFCRLTFARRLASIPAIRYIRETTIPLLLLLISVTGVSYTITYVLHESFYRIMATGACSTLLYLTITYLCVLSSSERAAVKSLTKRITRRI